MVRSTVWLGTWNNYPEDWKVKIKDSCDFYIVQLEKGDNGDNLHLQMAIKFKNSRHFTAVQKLFEGAHIEKALNWNACKNYCKKENTYQGQRINNIDKIINDPLNGKEPNDMQKQILDIVSEIPDDRTIHWFHDPVGNSGKTTLAKHLCLQRDDVIYICGKAADMRFGVFQWVEKKPLHCVIIDLSRTVENFVSYQGIEEIKNGIFFNTKYECGMCVFNNPHVIVLANFPPDIEALSMDKWNIHDVEAAG